MLWGDVSAKIVGMLEADTGAGGLFDSGSELINAVHLYGFGGDKPRPPYINLHQVASTSDEVFDKNRPSFEVGFQVDLYTIRDEGKTDHVAAIHRIDDVLRRQPVEDVTVGSKVYRGNHVYINQWVFECEPEGSLLRSTADCRVMMARSA